MRRSMQAAQQAKHALLVLAITALTLGGCALPQLPVPIQNESAAVGLVINDPTSYGRTGITHIVLVNLHDSQDIANQNDILFAGFRATLKFFGDRDHFYLFNVPPGNYAMVGYARNNFFWFIPETDIRYTLVELMPGRLNFMGKIMLDAPFMRDWKNPDAAQRHYGKLIRELKKVHTAIAVLGALGGQVTWPVTNKSTIKDVQKTIAAETEFLEASWQILEGAGWDAHIEKRLAELK